MTTTRPAAGGPTTRPTDLGTGRLPVEYILPLRWSDDDGCAELTGYLRWLSERVSVTVIDGSPPELFDRHAACWPALVRHLAPDPALRYRNGKVNGVLTGIRLARHERLVVADDDVRYDDDNLRTVCRLLARADLVRPQNYFDPLPWHACWDTGRTLLNRAVGEDYPGTFGLRRSTVLAMGGYDGDVLFENLELLRTVRGFGGVESCPPDLYVRRLPPTARRFWSQRVRQAYDDLAMPPRMLTFLAVLPAAVALGRLDRRLLPVAVATVVALAERGRRRSGGRHVFPVRGSLLAPLWVLERAVCSWAALGLRFGRGGVPYAGRRIRTAAHSQRWLQRTR
ncbi:glycosyltransferase [Micromonospora sp. NBC_01796]|uniref:glycosyltransferase n=1 Tax=Micromonospora sp. NBC_01796 TaxID=2975987 RepID=UPI002DDA788B|nr:glycosyltransferase [Micromonospora sp. NBC_01796]WSA83254.1 glycosyltransferase family 2 protein [Micromonospora sp. NBC_01796]